jgi:hypothetical protein
MENKWNYQRMVGVALATTVKQLNVRQLDIMRGRDLSPLLIANMLNRSVWRREGSGTKIETQICGSFKT